MPNGSATGPPEPKSVSAASRAGALVGLKKSLADRVPLVLTASRTTDSASWPGGDVPLPLGGEMPLPEVRKIRPDPSDMSPPPLCQMPAWSGATPFSSVHRVNLCVDVDTFTPATYPA